ncbi:MAG: hypothetical protein JXL81_06305 [Deltaproteobacteria bacterium]|nr:hypothetical protein [Deltaproteobacteria bacterium]
MTDEKTTQVDEYTIRCPRLGHAVTFSYCRGENNGLPCFKTLDCWFQYFPVEEYLRERLTQEEWEKAFVKKGKTKVQSLIELIEEAKKRAGT